MNQADILELLRSGIWTAILASAPVLGIGLGVGLAISLLQALTQVQEATLSFVPKIVLMMVGVVLSLPFMFGLLSTFMDQVVARISGP